MDVLLFADPEKRGWRRHAVLHTCWACLLCNDFYLQGTRLVVFFSVSRWPLSRRLVFFTYRGRTFPIKTVLTEFVKRHTIWCGEVFSSHAPSPHVDRRRSQKTAKLQQINFQDWFKMVSKKKKNGFSSIVVSNSGNFLTKKLWKNVPWNFPWNHELQGTKPWRDWREK